MQENKEYRNLKIGSKLLKVGIGRSAKFNTIPLNKGGPYPGDSNKKHDLSRFIKTISCLDGLRNTKSLQMKRLRDFSGQFLMQGCRHMIRIIFGNYIIKRKEEEEININAIGMRRINLLT